MSRKPNILIVTSFWIDEGIGGVAEMGRALAQELAKSRDVTVFINRWSAPFPRQEISEEGFDLIFLRVYSPWNPNRPILGFLRWIISFPANLYRIHRIIKERNINIVQIRFISSYHYIFRILHIFGGPPYCISFHGSDLRLFDTYHPCSRALIKWTLAGASGISAVSQSLAHDTRRRFPNIGNVAVIRNGKPITFKYTSKEQLDANLKSKLPEFYFVNPANVTHVKGQDNLIRSWANLPESLKHVHLLIAGEARDSWDNCKQLIEELNCADRVHLLGPLPQSDLFSIMAPSMGCIMGSRSEGFSGSVLEAGVLSLAVICTDIPPFKEIIQHNRNGLIVPVDDAASMAKAISKLVRDPALRQRLGRCLRNDVRSKFTIEQMAKNYLAFYTGVLEKS